MTFSVFQVGLRNIGLLWLASLRLAGAKLDKWFTKVDSIGRVFQCKIKGVYIYILLHIVLLYCFCLNGDDFSILGGAFSVGGKIRQSAQPINYPIIWPEQKAYPRE